MSWQHHARFVPGTNETQITLFDNHSKLTTHGQCESDCSRGLHIAIDDTSSPPTVQLLREFRHPSQLQAQSQGSMQPLSPSPDDLGNVFIGWGRCPTFTEHSSSGKTVMDVQFSPWHSDEIPDALDNYRAYKMNWSATPWWDPAIAPRKNQEGELVIYVSWNGATEVASWVVRGAASDLLGQKGEVLSMSRRTGFETKLTIGQTDWRYLWAEAVDGKGRVLRSTEVVDLKTTNLSVAYDTYEDIDCSFPPSKAENPGRFSTTVPIFLGTGLGVFILATIVVGVFLWRRRRDYNHLKAEDFDLDLEEDYDNAHNDGEDVDGTNIDVDPQLGVDEDRRALIPKAEPGK